MELVEINYCKKHNIYIEEFDVCLECENELLIKEEDSLYEEEEEELI